MVQTHLLERHLKSIKRNLQRCIPVRMEHPPGCSVYPGRPSQMRLAYCVFLPEPEGAGVNFPA
ncbi:MAG: hypothetical protein WD048_07905 [Chitinophagales bacterium]